MSASHGNGCQIHNGWLVFPPESKEQGVNRLLAHSLNASSILNHATASLGASFFSSHCYLVLHEATEVKGLPGLSTELAGQWESRGGKPRMGSPPAFKAS